MRFIVLLVPAMLLAQAPAHRSQPPVRPAAATPNLDQMSDDQKAIYALGVSIGKTFSLSPEEIAAMQAGLKDGSTGKASIDMAQWQPKIGALAQARMAKKSAEYLEKAAAEPGATKLPSGLIYRETRPGTGASPQATDTVKVNYRGTLADGTEFDSSYKRNEPATFALNGVIPCWTEGLQHMKVGGEAQLVCPANLAYGDRPMPGIPPGSTLIFHVELLDVTPQPAH
jgi:FKBP-type peptidyl-prolyl cis-trans isomerase FkpA